MPIELQIAATLFTIAVVVLYCIAWVPMWRKLEEREREIEEHKRRLERERGEQ